MKSICLSVFLLTIFLSVGCKKYNTENHNSEVKEEFHPKREEGRPPPPRGPRRNIDKNRPENFITTNDPINNLKLHSAFKEFDVDQTDIYIDDINVVIESTGLPNHTTPYWGDGHPLYIEPISADKKHMTPTTLQNTHYDSTMLLRVAKNPKKANKPSSTSMGAIGISVSGAAIFNDQEGNGALSDNVASGLDYAGGHIGPAEYHYHLEPKPITYNDDKLVGIISDGFFIYGRKCNSTGTYPTDLDVSGGHTHKTQHSDKEEYHYHIINELYGNTCLLYTSPSPRDA